MAEGGGGGPQISFKFQVGLTKDRVVVDSIDLTLKSIKTLACDFINEKFAEHGISRLAERLMVFRHDYTATNALQVMDFEWIHLILGSLAEPQHWLFKGGKLLEFQYLVNCTFNRLNSIPKTLHNALKCCKSDILQLLIYKWGEYILDGELGDWGDWRLHSRGSFQRYHHCQ